MKQAAAGGFRRPPLVGFLPARQPGSQRARPLLGDAPCLRFPALRAAIRRFPARARRQLAHARRAQDQRRAGTRRRAERLAQHERGQQHRDDRVEIAHQRDGRRAERLHGGKVKRIRDAGVQHPGRQQQQRGARRQRLRRAALYQQRVRQQHHRRRKQLHGRARPGRHARHALVDQHDARIQRRRQQRIQHAARRAVRRRPRRRTRRDTSATPSAATAAHSALRRVSRSCSSSGAASATNTGAI